MSFERDYIELINYAKYEIRKSNIPNLEPEDLVSDAFIKYQDDIKEYNLYYIKKLIKNSLYKEISHNSLMKWEFYKEEKITSKYCYECNSIKPAVGFYIKNTNSIISLFKFCKDCYNKKHRIYYLSNKNNILFRQKEYYQNNKIICIEKAKINSKIWKSNNKDKVSKIQNNWYEKNREKWNDYIKERSRNFGIKSWDEHNKTPIKDLWKKANKKYIQKQKENLTDVYIKSLLRHKCKNITQEMINSKRQELLFLRKNP